MYIFSESSKHRLSTVKPELISVFNQALKTSYLEGLSDWGISSGNRTAEEQLRLFCKGRIESGEIVTHRDGYNKKSNHQGGRAVDIYVWKDGKAWFDEESIRPIAEVIKRTAKQQGIVVNWGWDLWKWDAPHFELG